MKIAFLGDIALFGRNTVKNDNVFEKFSTVKRIVKDCNYIIGNLESPLTNEAKTIGGKSAYLKGAPENVEILNYLGITHVSLANNHVMDYRRKGLKDTVGILERKNIKWYGVEGKKEFIEFKNNKLCLMGYCCFSTNAKGLTGKEPIVNILNPVAIENDIAEAESKGYLPVLSFHWGQEHVFYPNYDHLQIARRLTYHHRVIIHGHHPHVIQGIETWNESLISYSLGNFCFDDIYTRKSKDPLIRLSKDNQETIILIVEIENNKILNYNVMPLSFQDGTYRIENSIFAELQKRNDFLNTPKSNYIKIRTWDLNTYLNNRKKNRDLNWYMKRMNFESVKMIISAKRNSRKYKEYVSNYIMQRKER